MITPTLVEPTENHQAGVASGVWSTQDQLEARRGGVWPEAGVTNPDTLIENIFSTTLYNGNGTADIPAANTITTGINLSGTNDGLVWIKGRSYDSDHALFDTKRGVGNRLSSHNTSAQDSFNDSDTDSYFRSFNDDGFSIGYSAGTNNSSQTYVSWTFKAAPKFFDVVTYTGTGSTQNVSHSLGSIPGMIIVRRYNAGNSDWGVYHRGANGGSNPENYRAGRLNSTAASNDDDTYWNDTAPTASVFTVETSGSVNNDGDSYVAYLFAHETGSDSTIQCGYYEGSETAEDVGAVGRVVNLGWEPQWLLVKNSNANSNWIIMDSMRGVFSNTDGNNIIELEPSTDDEESSNPGIVFTSTGFHTFSNQTLYNSNNQNFIYVAIRRPNMATITDATEVFAMASRVNTSAGVPNFTSNFPVDFAYNTTYSTDGVNKETGIRMTGPHHMDLNATTAEAADANHVFDMNNGWHANEGTQNFTLAWMWRRAKGYFDVVAYNGGGGAKNISHGLGAVPEMMWVKRRNGAAEWYMYHKDTGNHEANYVSSDGGYLDNTNLWNDTTPTSSVFTIGSRADLNQSNGIFVALLFSTLAGVSKVGSYTGTGSSFNVDCGFTSGARYVMIKYRAGGATMAFDTTRGIQSGVGDKLLKLDDENGQTSGQTDYINPHASGFATGTSSTVNTNGREYLFYAIA